MKYLKVRYFFFYNYNRELHLFVKPYKNGCRCPICNRRCKIINQPKIERTCKDIKICGITIFFHYAPKEIDCFAHGRYLENIPWADTYSRITYRLEYLILKYAQIMTQKDAEGLNRITKIVKNRASGFRTLESFTDMIYLIVGDINIPSKIEPMFRI